MTPIVRDEPRHRLESFDEAGRRDAVSPTADAPVSTFATSSRSRNLFVDPLSVCRAIIPATDRRISFERRVALSARERAIALFPFFSPLPLPSPYPRIASAPLPSPTFFLPFSKRAKPRTSSGEIAEALPQHSLGATATEIHYSLPPPPFPILSLPVHFRPIHSARDICILE